MVAMVASTDGSSSLSFLLCLVVGGDKQWGSALTRLDRSPRVVQEVVVGVHPLHWVGEDDDQPSERLYLPEQLRGRDVVREVAAVRALSRPVQLGYGAKG